MSIGKAATVTASSGRCRVMPRWLLRTNVPGSSTRGCNLRAAAGGRLAHASHRGRRHTPWSYLSASILSREAAEFGAIWHGCVWSDQTILSKPPRQADGQDASDDARTLTGDAPVGNWTWHGAVSRMWKPTYVDMGATKEVVLHIYNPMGQEEIYRATDTYPAGSYDGKTETTVLCTGDGFSVY